VAVAAAQVMRSLLFGVAPFDPVAFLGVIALLSAVALAAMYRPAARAARVDPARTLRTD
jgi:ABC-type lipoprotein release transport system permease subunit